MTIERTREIYGDKISHLSDQKVLEFISNMGVICDDILDTLLTGTLKNRHSKKGIYD